MSLRTLTQEHEPPDQIAVLIRKVAEGDANQVGQLVERTAQVLYAMIRRIVHKPELADSVLCEVYAQVWQEAHRFCEDRGRGMTWLGVLARSRAIDAIRRENAQRAEPTDTVLLQLVPSKEKGPGQAAVANEQTIRVRAALRRLPREQQRAIQAAFFEGMTHRQLALALDLPLGTVKTRIRLALISLRRTLDGEGHTQ